MKRFLFITLCCALSLSVAAQGTRPVRGVVFDSDGTPMPNVTLTAVGTTDSKQSGADGTFEMMVSPYTKLIEASKEGFISARAEVDGSYLVFKLQVDKKYAENKAKAEEEARLAAEKAAEAEQARIAAEKAAAEKAAAEGGVGVPTLNDIVAELLKPGRDVRDSLPPPELRADVLSMEDLKPEMILNGVVRNVIDFGAFVDIGVHQDGLVHISEISDRFIRHPSEVLSVGDQVKVRVLAVDLKKKRISLTMKGVK